MDTHVVSDREKEVLNKAIAILTEALHPKRIILFGSRAKGRFQKGSDFDLAVDGERPELRREREIHDQVTAAAGLYNVDIVYLNSVEEDFRDLILRTGRTVYEKRS